MELPSSPRLRFRRYELGDVADVFRLFADPDARRFYPRSTDLEAAEGWVRWSLRNYDEHGFGLWAIELRETGEFAGDCGVTLQPVDQVSRHEVGYHVMEPLRRQGLATEAATVCRDWVLDTLGVPFVCSLVHPENVASIRVAERVHARCRDLAGVAAPRRLYYTGPEAG